MSDLRDRLDGVLVCTRADLRTLPPLHQVPGTEIRLLDLSRPDEIATWLAVHNAAFGHRWTERNVRDAVLEHDHIRVTATYLLTYDDEPAAVASIGRYRRNVDVGVGHYLGVVPERQRLGLARAVSLHRYFALRDEGVQVAESQTHIGRPESLRMHFGLGFRPKWRLDEWNNPDRWSRPTRALTDPRLRRLYRQWDPRATAAARPNSEAQPGSAPGERGATV